MRQGNKRLAKQFQEEQLRSSFGRSRDYEAEGQKSLGRSSQRVVTSIATGHKHGIFLLTSQKMANLWPEVFEGGVMTKERLDPRRVPWHFSQVRLACNGL